MQGSRFLGGHQERQIMQDFSEAIPLSNKHLILESVGGRGWEGGAVALQREAAAAR